MSGRFDAVSRLISRHVAVHSAAEDDSALLARFLMDRDETAFEQLLQRYGAMVYGICRRALPSPSDAEDAFQATFLALVARVRKVGPIEGVGGWLYRAATHVSSNLRRGQRRQLARETRAAKPDVAHDRLPGEAEELAALDEEVARLPEQYRDAVVRCHVLNQTLTEAASALGVSVTSVWKRVQRGEELLRKRLSRRGLIIPAGAFAALLGGSSVGASPPTSVQAAAKAAAGGEVAARVTQLAAAAARAVDGGSNVVWLIAVSLIVGVGVAVAGFAFGLPNSKGEQVDVRVPAVPTPAQPVAPFPEAHPTPRPLAVLTGVAIDVNGQPIPGARVTVLGGVAQRGEVATQDRILATGRADAEGRFRIPISVFPGSIEEERRVQVVVAGASGSAVATDTVSLTPGRDPQPLTARVASGPGIAGRVLGPNGQPAVGAVVRVSRIGNVAVGSDADDVPETWPTATRTGPNGDFMFAALDPQVGVSLTVEHPTDGVGVAAVSGPTEAVVKLAKARRVAIRAVYADTGRPAAGARVMVVCSSSTGWPKRGGQTDSEGQFAGVAPAADRTTVYVIPPIGEPYVAVSATAAGESKTIQLPRGVILRGRVVDAASDSPVPNPQVQFIPRGDGVLKDGVEVFTGGAAVTIGGDDGRFEIVAPPGPGTVLVHSSSLRYAPTETDIGSLIGGDPAGFRVYAHALIPVVADPAVTTPDLTARLTLGTTLEGRVEFPDGSPVQSGRMLCRHLVGARNIRTPVGLPIRDGTFAIPGCRPGRVYTVLLADATGRFGAVARLECPVSGSPAPAIIRLQPCGSADVRVATASGRPVAGTKPLFWTVVHPDSPIGGPPRAPEMILGQWAGLGVWRPGEIPPNPLTGPNGVARLTGLTPGLSYAVSHPEADLARPPARFTAQSATTVSVPSILLRPND